MKGLKVVFVHDAARGSFFKSGDGKQFACDVQRIPGFMENAVAFNKPNNHYKQLFTLNTCIQVVTC